MKRILLLCFMFFTVFAFSALAQRTVSGTVTDDAGESLPGVNVVIKGTTTGTTTDIDGNFRLSVEDGATLVFSFVGFETQEVEVGARSVIDITMGGVTELQEVVVTGYGVEQKRDLTGSIANVGEAEMSGTTQASFTQQLQGRAAGVQVQASSGQPGAFARVVVRGQGSLGNNTPLYIVDGIQVNTDDVAGQGSDNVLASINPNDISSIEILKDAAAAAIYGAQAANGVVLITTKKGASGKTSIELSHQRGVSTPIGTYDVLNAEQLAELKVEAYTNNPGTDPDDAITIFGDPATVGAGFDWVDFMFRDAATYEIWNGSARGGDEKTKFFFSVSQERQEGQIILSEWERSTVRLNLDHQATDKLSVSTQLAGSRQNFFGTITNGNFVNGPFVATYSSHPSSTPITGDPNNPFFPYPRSGASHLFNYNIVEGVFEEVRTADIAQVLGNMKASYKVMDELTVSVFGGVDFVSSVSKNQRPSTIPVFSGFGGQAFVDERGQTNWNANITANYSKTFGSDHTVTGLIGTEWRKNNRRRTTATVRGFANPVLRQLSDGATLQAIVGTLGGWSRFGAFARGTYNYQNKYYINGTFRKDGDSRFGATTRFGTFYSVGASWRVIEEDFMASVSAISDLKLRFSQGVVGNANTLGDFQAIPSFQPARQYQGASGQTVLLADDALTWEESEQFNVGIDFGILNNRISGSFDYFQNDTKNQLQQNQVTDDAGRGSLIRNTGTVRNDGIEIELNTVNIDNGDLKWETYFNITFQNNELLEVGQLPDTTTNYVVGLPIDYFWGVDYAGVNPANGRSMWINRDNELVYGNVGFDDAYFLGSSIPDSYGGFGNTITYKGLSLDIFFQYQLGAEAFLGDLYNLLDHGGLDNQLVEALDRWQQPGDITNIPIAYQGGSIDGFNLRFPGQTTGQFLSDASYIRLKQITLNYDLPSSLLNNVKLSGASVFLRATNLATWTKFRGIDPEVVTQNNDVGASSYGTFPVSKQFGGGITLKF